MTVLPGNRSYDYSRRDQAFLIDNWLKLDGFDLPGKISISFSAIYDISTIIAINYYPLNVQN